MSEGLERDGGQERPAIGHGGARPLRVLPDPDSPEARAEALAAGWAEGVTEPDWCVDAHSVLPGHCDGPATDAVIWAAAMPASERRAVHLTRQRIRAQAILAAPEPSTPRRDRARRWAIVLASVVAHAGGFVLLANAVADLQPRERAAHHDHLFEAPAVVPFEPAPVEPAEPNEAIEAIAPDEVPAAEPAEPRAKPAAKSKPATPTPTPAAAPTGAPAGGGEPAPYRLQGFELSSADARGAGHADADGQAWGRPGGSGSGGGGSGGKGSGSGSGGSGASQPDVAAQPRGGLLEPEYPPALERAGVEGSVLVKVWIDEHGHVIKAEVVESSGEEAFDHNALMTAQRQEWVAATVDGQAVATTRRYRVHFRQR